jgi:hypothetical protein
MVPIPSQIEDTMLLNILDNNTELQESVRILRFIKHEQHFTHTSSVRRFNKKVLTCS